MGLLGVYRRSRGGLEGAHTPSVKRMRREGKSPPVGPSSTPGGDRGGEAFPCAACRRSFLSLVRCHHSIRHLRKDKRR
eukprot:739962-Prorocentrum_minimum.AAC.1